MLVVLWSRRKDVEEPLARVANLQYTGHVATPVAVVGRAPDRAQPVIVQDLEALLTQLVGSEDVIHVVYRQELLDYLRAKGVACPAGAEGELVSLGVWVGPYKVGHGAFMGDFAEAVDDDDLVDRVDGGG